MRVGKMVSIEELEVVSHFESLRRTLLSDQSADILNKPLAYWALPADRRLPLALLGRTLSNILNTPFPELSATPGIGRRKIASLIILLARAANTDPADLPVELPEVVDGQLPQPEVRHVEPEILSSNGFDPMSVSEVAWAQWRASIVRHGLSGENLGRLAPSLRNMTRVVWNTPLGVYTSSGLAEIRAMKTHGEKRVAAILEVFHAVHTIVAGMGTSSHFAVRIVPRQIDRVEQWIGRALQQPGVPSRQELFSDFVSPLLEQIRIDSAQQVYAMAETRLGVNGPLISVRQVARTMGLTRARVYQLLNEINDIMVVRWPNGRHQVHELREKFAKETADSDGSVDLRQFHAAVELFYPGSRRGAAGPLEHTFDSFEQDDELLEVS